MARAKTARDGQPVGSRALAARARRRPADPEPGSLERIIDDWRREVPNIDVSPMRILARIARIEAMKRPYLHSTFAEHGLNAGLFDVLAALRRASEPYRSTPTELAESTMLTTGGITGRLDKLEALGLIEREPSRDDRRVTYAKLTALGLQTVDAVLDEHLANERRLLASLTTAQVGRLAKDLAALERSVRAATGGRMEVPTS